MTNFWDIPAQLQLSWPEWGIAYLAVLLAGLAKGGVKGIGITIVTMMVLVFGGKASTGIVLLTFMLGDILAVSWYRRHTQWKYLRKLMPSMIAGVLLGVWIGKDLPEVIFKRGMAVIIFVCVALIFYWEKHPPKKIPDSRWFAYTMGFIAGFTTMIGNLAGPFANIFFLAIRLPKAQFIGTAAWLFFLINIFKLPFHIFVWETVTLDTLLINLWLLPGLLLGFGLALISLKYIKEEHYRQLILALTAMGAALILFG